MMLQFPCTSLSGLAKLLRVRYDTRSKMIVRNFPDLDLLTEEYEIIRINRLITRHRRRCPHCKLQGSFATMGARDAMSFRREDSLSLRQTQA